MRVLITGAAGRIGSMLLDALSDRFEVRATDVRLPEVRVAGQEFAVGDITDERDAFRLCNGMDALVHLAGHPNPKDWETAIDLNMKGSRIMLEAAVRAGARRLVLASSTHAAGYEPADFTFEEASSFRPDGPYGVSKAFGELVLQYLVDRHGVAGIALRICSYRPRPTLARELRTWISPGDMARLVEAALTAPISGYRCVWGLSANAGMQADWSAWQEIGYRPLDDASVFTRDFQQAGVDISIVSEWPYLGGPSIVESGPARSALGLP